MVLTTHCTSKLENSDRWRSRWVYWVYRHQKLRRRDISLCFRYVKHNKSKTIIMNLNFKWLGTVTSSLQTSKWSHGARICSWLLFNFKEDRITAEWLRGLFLIGRDVRNYFRFLIYVDRWLLSTIWLLEVDSESHLKALNFAIENLSNFRSNSNL